MTIELGTLLAVIIALVTGVFGYGRLSRSVETHREEYEKETDKTAADHLQEHGNLWKVIGDLRRQLEDHLRDSAEKRLELEKELGKIRGNTDNIAFKLETMLSTITEKIDSIQKTVEKIENKN